MNNAQQFEQMMENPDVGHNGGMPDAGLWFVGLENNAGDEDACAAHNWQLIKGEVTRLTGQDFWSKFNRVLRDMLVELKGVSGDVAASDMYSGDNFFCANLYPFACPKTNSEANIFDLTGLSKSQYMMRCDLLRHDSVAWHNFYCRARVIVCMGCSCWESFIMQFTRNATEYESAMRQYWNAWVDSQMPDIVTIRLPRRTLILCPHPHARGGARRMNVADVIEHIRRAL